MTDEERVTVMPTAEKMVSLFRSVREDVRFYGMYDRVSHNMAGVEIYASEVVVMVLAGVRMIGTQWQQDALEQVPAWIDALVPDKEIANNAKTMFKSIQEKTKNQGKPE